MKFMVSLITDGTVMENTTPEQMAEFGARMGEYMGELRDSGALADPRRGDRVAERMPVLGGAIEVRPIVEPPSGP